MIIKNNFNSKSIEPLKDDYKVVGKGSMNTDKRMENVHLKKVLIENDEKNDRENDDMSNHDKWSFFK